MLQMELHLMMILTRLWLGLLAFGESSPLTNMADVKYNATMYAGMKEIRRCTPTSLFQSPNFGT